MDRAKLSEHGRTWIRIMRSAARIATPERAVTRGSLDQERRVGVVTAAELYSARIAGALDPQNAGGRRRWCTRMHSSCSKQFAGARRLQRFRSHTAPATSCSYCCPWSRRVRER